MKTIEEKAERYDEAIKRAKELLEIGVKDTRDKGIVLSFFPELKESEDEKIRKQIISFLKEFEYDHYRSLDFSSWIAWLEKQGKQKSADKVEPKFKIGDFIANDCCRGKVVELTNDAYLLDTGQGILFSYEHNIHLWTIEDAKDGDVLCLGDVIAIFKKYIGQEKCICYCSSCDKGGFEIPIENGEDNVYGCTSTTPATKEQRDILFQRMKEAGYEWDANKKELIKL